MCEAEEIWDHVIMRDENKQTRDEWIQNVQEKFKILKKMR